jgi:long-chain acyl-CoA synthetase
VPIAQSLRGKRVFITGATGFLGRVLVEKILWSVPDVGTLRLLIRADRERGADERLRQDVFGAALMDRLRARHGDAWDAWIASRVEAVPGDLGDDRFGLDPAAYAALCGSIDMVVASAATVTFDERLDRSLSLNTRGAGRTLALARDAGNVPLLHVSTCFVSGQREGVVPERVLAPPRGGAFDLSHTLRELDELCGSLSEARQLVEAGAAQAARYGFTDVYTLTKSLGEQLLARDRGAVPVTIVRPATVESALREPMPGWIDAIKVTDPLLVAYGRGRTREFPGDAATQLDIIPVDHVVNAMLAAMAELTVADGAGLRVYQVGSSRNPLTVGRLLEHARRGFARWPFLDEQGAPIAVEPARFVAPDALRRSLMAQRGRVRVMGRLLRGRGWGRSLGGTERALDHFLRLIDVYAPYMAHRAQHADEETRGLWSRLSAADQAEFPFDITVLDWLTYIAAVHVPGVQRYALHAETGAPVTRTADDLTRRHAEGLWASDGAATLYQLFETAAGLDPDGVAFQICRSGRWLRYTYEEARAAVGNIAMRLADQYGIAPGDRVALVSTGCPEWTLTTLAVFRLGAATVPLDPQWPAGETIDAAAFAGAKLICVAPALRAAFAGAACPVVTLAAPFVPAPHVGGLPGSDRQCAAGRGSDLASIIFTSGTTVAPKAVPLTHENFLSNVRALMPLIRSSRERMLSVLPVHHVFEMVMGHWVPMASGSTVTYLAELKPVEIMWTLRAAQPTMMVVVPRLIDLLYNGVSQRVASGGPLLRGYFRAALALSEWTGGRFGTVLFAKVHTTFGGHLRRIVAGGSALEPRLGKQYQRLGIAIAEGYGMTETSPVLTVNPWDGIRFGTVGKPIPGVEVELRPIEGGADPGAGEIWVRGSNVMSGYYGNPEATAAVLRDGWLSTGDIGRFGADGYLAISGRTKDVIVTDAGKNVYPEEVEVRYRDLPGVREMAVIGVPGSGRGERVCAVVAPGPQATGDEIRAAVEARSAGVPSYQQITQIEIWRGDFPKTTTLKVKRGKLREAVLAGQRGDGRAPAPTTPAAPAGAGLGKDEVWVIDTLARLTRGRADAIQASSRLGDLGIDSLTKVELVGEIETRLGFRLDDARAGALTRVEDLLDLVRARA